MQTLVKIVTKYLLPSTNYKERLLSPFPEPTFSNHKVLLWNTLKDAMEHFKGQLEPRLYTLICFLVMVSGKDLVLLMEGSDS